MTPKTYFDFKEQGRIGQIQEGGGILKSGAVRFDVQRWTGTETVRERASCSSLVWEILGLYPGCEVALAPDNQVLARVDSRGDLIFPDIPA